MKIISKVSILSSFLFITACTVVNKSNTAKSTEVEIKTIIPNQLLVDLNVVGEKSSGTSSGKGKLVSLDDLKQNAIAEALKKTDSDVLVEPIYTVEATRGLLTYNVTVSVTGYPAKYKNFRTLAVQDTLLLNIANKYRVPTISENKSNNAFNLKHLFRK